MNKQFIYKYITTIKDSIKMYLKKFQRIININLYRITYI